MANIPLGVDAGLQRTVPPAAIIGLGHHARVGKDTLARYLVENHGYTRIAFADSLREVAPLLDLDLARRLRDHGGDWEAAKVGDPYVRAALQRIGEAVRQATGEDVWVRALARKLRPGELYVIPDVRYRIEAMFVQRSGGLLVEVRRPGFGPAGDHRSEHDLDDWARWDAVVQNADGPGRLAEAASWLAARAARGPVEAALQASR